MFTRNTRLEDGAGVLDLGRDVGLVLLEGLVEHATELLDLGLEGGLVGPGLGGVEDLGGNTGDRLGDGEVEDGELLVLGLGERTIVDGVDNSTGVLEGAAAASAELAASPSGVDEPAVDLVLVHALGKHLGVAAGVEDDEGLAVAGREGGRGLNNAVLGTGGLRGVTSNEVVLSLLRRETRDGGKDTESVAGEHDDVRRLAVGNARNLGVGDVLDGVGATSVLGDRDVVVVGNAVSGVVDNVLEDGTEADGVVDLGLLLGREVDALGVASTLNVEDTSVGPDVLVVTDQETVGVSRKGGLSGSGETEEEGDVAGLAVGRLGLVGRGVKGELAELDGLEVVHDGEDTLLHLTGVLGTEDDHLHALEVDLDGGGGGHSGGETVGRELASVVDDEVGLSEVGELLGGGTDKHVVHEESVVGARGDDADLDAVLGVPAGETVEDVDVLTGVEVVDGTLTVDLEGVLVEGNVDRAPPDVVLGGLLVDDTLVLGRTAGLLAGEVDQSSGRGDDGTLVDDGILVKGSDGGVALREASAKRSRR